MAYKFRKGINFARKIEKYYKKEKLFLAARKSAIGLTFLTTAITVFVIFLNIKISIQTRSLTIERKKLLDSLLEHSIENEKLFVISDKVRFAKKILNTEDVRFLTYYKAVDDVIKEISKQSTESAIQIQQFQLDKNRNVNFEITTESLQGYLSFLDSIDETKFLNLFEDLTLTRFNITKSSNSDLYTLKFKGRFKQLDEKD